MTVASAIDGLPISNAVVRLWSNPQGSCLPVLNALGATDKSRSELAPEVVLAAMIPWTFEPRAKGPAPLVDIPCTLLEEGITDPEGRYRIMHLRESGAFCDLVVTATAPGYQEATLTSRGSEVECTSASQTRDLALYPGPGSGPHLVDFETPIISGQEQIDSYEASGVEFTVEGDGGPNPPALGLVWNSATSVCIEPASEDQNLGTGTQATAPTSIGFSNFPIRASLQEVRPAGTFVSVDIQTGIGDGASGGRMELTLFGPLGEVVGVTNDAGYIPHGRCPGYQGGQRTLFRMYARADAPVASAVIRALGNIVFVIDDFDLQ